MSKINPNSQANEGTIWFDYFLATDPTLTSTIGLLPTNSPQTTSSDKNLPVGAIVGGVIGFFVAIGIILAVLLYFRSRRPVAHKKEEYGEEFGLSISKSSLLYLVTIVS